MPEDNMKITHHHCVPDNLEKNLCGLRRLNNNNKHGVRSNAGIPPKAVAGQVFQQMKILLRIPTWKVVDMHLIEARGQIQEGHPSVDYCLAVTVTIPELQITHQRSKQKFSPQSY